jgi:hypothetical protein
MSRITDQEIAARMTRYLAILRWIGIEDQISKLYEGARN